MRLPGWQTGSHRVISHSCHQTGHYAPVCALRFCQYLVIITNYDSLNADDRALYPVLPMRNHAGSLKQTQKKAGNDQRSITKH